MLHLFALVLLKALCRYGRAISRLAIHVVALEFEQLVLQAVVLLIRLFHLGFLVSQLALEPGDLFLGLLLLKLSLLAVALHVLLLV